MGQDTKPISFVFFGTGPVAAKSLELLAKNFTVEAVVTKPKPSHHKGNFPVLEVAEKLGLSVNEVTDKEAVSKLFKTANFSSSVGVLIDFGIIVSKDVIDYFPKGIVNSHFSLLPEWRGADPISSAILSGQEKTGVSFMLLVETMDEGPLLAQSPYEINPGSNGIDVTNDLIKLSAKGLLGILPLYLDNKTTPLAQEKMTIASSTTPTYSKKLTKSDGVIDWNKSAEVLDREIRAYIEWPKSSTKLAGIDVIITKAHAMLGKGEAGSLEIVDKEALRVYSGDGYLCIDRLKPAGKKEMSIQEFLLGYGSRLA